MLPEDLPALHAAAAAHPGRREVTVYACYLGTQHLVRRKATAATCERAPAGFDVSFRDEHYYANPGLRTSEIMHGRKEEDWPGKIQTKCTFCFCTGR